MGSHICFFNLFRDQLESDGVSDDHIIEMAFDLYENIEYGDPMVDAVDRILGLFAIRKYLR